MTEPKQREPDLVPMVGDFVLSKSALRLCTVELGETPGTDGGTPLVFVRSVSGGEGWWAELTDLVNVSERTVVT